MDDKEINEDLADAFIRLVAIFAFPVADIEAGAKVCVITEKAYLAGTIQSVDANDGIESEGGTVGLCIRKVRFTSEVCAHYSVTHLIPEGDSLGEASDLWLPRVSGLLKGMGKGQVFVVPGSVAAAKVIEADHDTVQFASFPLTLTLVRVRVDFMLVLAMAHPETLERFEMWYRYRHGSDELYTKMILELRKKHDAYRASLFQTAQ